MTNLVLNINMDKKCAECGKPCVTDSGICLRCVTKAMGDKPMKSRQGIAVQKRWREKVKEWRIP